MFDEKEESPASETTTEVETEAETEESTEETGEFDYKAELDSVKRELEKKTKQVSQAEHVIEKLKSAPKEIAAPDIEQIIERKVEEKLQAFSNQVRGDAIDTLISDYASSKDEAELIRFHLENSIRQSGDDITDILNAKALANKARLVQKTSEIKRSQLRPEADQERSGGAKTPTKEKITFSPEEMKIMKQFGLTAEDMKNGVRAK